MAWFLGGCGLYYALGVALAAALKDNRAFCKYACPVSVFLRAASRVSVLRVDGRGERCTRCGACDRACPMGVRVSGYVDAGARVLDPECTLCRSCLASCPQGNIGLSLGLDLGSSRPPPARG